MLILIIRGLLSVWLSRAMETLSARLTVVGQANVLTDHGNVMCWFCNVNAMIAQCITAHARGEKIILIGHSFGATSALMITRALAQKGITVDYLGPIDPAGQYDTSIGSNVRLGRSYYQLTPGQLGQGIVHPASANDKAQFNATWTVTRRYETHLAIPADPVVQDAIFHDVMEIMK